MYRQHYSLYINTNDFSITNIHNINEAKLIHTHSLPKLTINLGMQDPFLIFITATCLNRIVHCVILSQERRLVLGCPFGA